MKCDNLESSKERKKLILRIQENIILIETGNFFNIDDDVINYNLIKYNYLDEIEEKTCINCVQEDIILYNKLLINAKLENNILNMNIYSYKLRNEKSLFIFL